MKRILSILLIFTTLFCMCTFFTGCTINNESNKKIATQCAMDEAKKYYNSYLSKSSTRLDSINATSVTHTGFNYKILIAIKYKTDYKTSSGYSIGIPSTFEIEYKVGVSGNKGIIKNTKFLILEK